MEPLTALGLAAGVVQFVSFASHIIMKTKETHVSASGQTDELLTLETTYTKLYEMSRTLETCSRRDSALEIVEANTDYAKNFLAIKDLARNCEGDCQRLLKIVEKLKTSDDSCHRWQALRVALRAAWKGNEISELEKRLHHTQMTLTLLVCSHARYVCETSRDQTSLIPTASSFWHARFDKSLRTLRSESVELNAQHSEKLVDISETLNELASRITHASYSSRMGANIFNSDDIEGIESQMARLSLNKAAVVKEHGILRSLSFDSRPVRHSSITDASARTFEWAFKESGLNEEIGPPGGLLEWLREGDGWFWVTGKPGSGKSTFMKFVAAHPTALSSLSHWARPKRPVLASHYFWSAGTSMQKSQQGLLQTLLYEIFHQLPDVIESVCVERWSKTIEQLAYEPWQVPELQRVLQRIADRQDIPVKFCFFVDGLDEFAGDHVDFCHSLRELAKSPNIKLCVSSREWNVFEDSFGSAGMDKKLYIHELTHDDIRYYAKSRLKSHPRWKSLNREAPKAAWLLEEITERAAGVFLWVFLVTRELRSGLSEYDSFSDLQRRLKCIPTDLEAFFKRILESVETFYIPKMATTLQIALAATEPVDAAVYNLHELEYEDQDYALRIPLQELSDGLATPSCEQTRRRLKARCRGLVEVNCHSNKVEFLHRSVMDFLRTAEMSTFLTDKAPRGFDARLSLARAFTTYIKTTGFPELVDRTHFNHCTESEIMTAVREILAQVSELRGEVTKAAYQLLDEIDRCIPKMHSSGQANLRILGNPANPVKLFFREALVDASFVEYLTCTLPGQPDYFIDFEKPVLSYVVHSLGESLGYSHWRRLELHAQRPSSPADMQRKLSMLRCLLENGCNPNVFYFDPLMPRDQERTPWKDLVEYADLCADDLGEALGFKQAILKEAINLMLQHGADPRLWSSNADMLQPVPNTTTQKRFLFQVDSELPGNIPKRHRAF